MGAAHSQPPHPANRRLWVIFGVLAALFAIAALVVGLFWPRADVTPAATDTARPTPSVTAPPGTPTPTPGSSAAPGSPQPASCNDLYSPEMVAAFGSMVLNPAW